MQRAVRLRIAVILALGFLSGCSGEEPAGPVVPAGGGTVIIRAEPDVLDPPWILLGPRSYQYSGTGDATLPQLEPGEYWLSWGPVPGWSAPRARSQTLLRGSTITFAGSYTEIP